MLPIVDAFMNDYEIWSTRPATFDEIRQNRSLMPINVALEKTIGDAHSAAVHIAEVGSDVAMVNHVSNALDSSEPYRSWQCAMPPKVPPEIARYQTDYDHADLRAVSLEIEQAGSLLSAGQYVFHGGLWPRGSTLVTSRPLSTSLCPQVALKNAEHKAKAYDSNRLDLLVLHVINPGTKAFVMPDKGTDFDHEFEVLFAAGACMTLKRETLIRSNFPTLKDNHTKEIPVYVLHVDVS